jgi:hypothetical protein
MGVGAGAGAEQGGGGCRHLAAELGERVWRAFPPLWYVTPFGLWILFRSLLTNSPFLPA